MPRFRSARSMTPFLMTARFQSVCPETGKTIHPGEQIAYFPQLNRAYHTDSRAAMQLREVAFANAWHMADANH
jgi:hypothetical protein